MKFAMIGAVLITLPAICALVYGLLFGPQVLVYAAAFSIGLNTLPFVAAGLMMSRQGGGADLGH